jgi:methyl-accepting chemotaxis protein
MGAFSRAKLLIFLLATVVFVGVGISGACYYIFAKYFNERAEEEISSKAHAMGEYLEDAKRQAGNISKLSANMKELVEAVAAKDKVRTQAIAKEIRESAGMDVVTIADDKGMVLGRGHSERTDDSVLEQANVRSALNGVFTTGVESGTVVKFSVRGGSPLKKDGRVVGAFVAGTDLSTGDAFVDKIKKLLGVECSIYEGDNRVSTTLMKDGKRAVGSKLENAKAREITLGRGDKFTGVGPVLGQESNTAYVAIKNGEGKITGMLGISISRHDIQRATQEMFSPVLMTIGAIILIAILLSFFAWSSNLLMESTLDLARMKKEGL